MAQNVDGDRFQSLPSTKTVQNVDGDNTTSPYPHASNVKSPELQPHF